MNLRPILSFSERLLVADVTEGEMDPSRDSVTLLIDHTKSEIIRSVKIDADQLPAEGTISNIGKIPVLAFD